MTWTLLKKNKHNLLNNLHKGAYLIQEFKMVRVQLTILDWFRIEKFEFGSHWSLVRLLKEIGYCSEKEIG